MQEAVIGSNGLAIRSISTVGCLQIRPARSLETQDIPSKHTMLITLVAPDYRKFYNIVKLAGNSCCQAKKLEHARAIRSAMSELSQGVLKNTLQTLISKDDKQIMEITQERNIAKLRSELQDSRNSLFVKL